MKRPCGCETEPIFNIFTPCQQHRCKVCNRRSWDGADCPPCCVSTGGHHYTPDTVVITIQYNGIKNYGHRCAGCRYRKPLRHADLTDEMRHAATVENDHRTLDNPCGRCGDTDTEVHHWAPSAIFEDSHQWPTSPLCPTCHRLWHHTMRAAGGYKLNDRAARK